MKKLLIVAALFTVALLLPVRAQTSPPAASPAGASPAAQPAASAGTLDPQKEKLIRELLARTKDLEMAQERILQGLAGLKQFMPRIPQKYWDEYRDRISMEEIRNRLVAVYDKHFTVDDLKAMLKFYESPAGVKMGEAAVPILRDSMVVSQEVSQRAGQEMSAQFRADQLLKQPAAAGSSMLQPLPPAPFSTGQNSPSPAASSTLTPAPTATPTAK